MKTNISKGDLAQASEAGILTPEQAEGLWSFLIEKNKVNPGFSGVNVAYYFGALVVISAMTWFATEAFSNFHALGLAVISVLYFIAFTAVGSRLHGSQATEIPGGLLLTAAIFMTPLFIFSIQDHFKLWVFEVPGDYKDYYTWIKSGWFFMELGTMAVALLFLAKFGFPFMTFPLSFTLWFLSMDATPIIFGMESFSADQRKIVSMAFGILMMAAAFLIDRRTRRDFAFWLYLFGVMSFWTGLTLLDSDSELSKLFYCCLNIGLIAVSVLLQRKVFIVFGALGVYGYLYHLSSVVFRDSMMFPIALSLLGLSIVFLAVLYRKNEARITGWLTGIIPEPLLKSLPPYRERM